MQRKYILVYTNFLNMQKKSKCTINSNILNIFKVFIIIINSTSIEQLYVHINSYYNLIVFRFIIHTNYEPILSHILVPISMQYVFYALVT